MTHEEPRFRVSRIVCIGILFAVPIIGPGSQSIILAVVAAISAYEGLRRGTVSGMAATLLGIELVYGFDIGVLSLSYAAAILMLAVTGRVVTITPWALSRGWHASDAFRAFIIACGLLIVMSASSVLIGYVLYGYGDMLARLQVVFMIRAMQWMPLSLAIVLVVLRRIDEPFRRHITFGV